MRLFCVFCGRCYTEPFDPDEWHRSDCDWGGDHSEAPEPRDREDFYGEDI